MKLCKKTAANYMTAALGSMSVSVVKTLINVTFCRAEHSEASLPLLQRE